MKIALIHISDIHLRTDRPNPVLRDESSMEAVSTAASARLSAHDCDACFLTVTGDIAYHGAPDEYKLAELFLTGVQRAIRARLPEHIPLHTVVVPGNHDCDFKTNYPETEARERLLTTDGLETVSQFEAEILTSVQRPYRKFEAALIFGDDRTAQSTGPCVQTHDFRLDKGAVRFYLLNTAWMSQEHETQGRLILPTNSIRPPDDTPSPSLSIVLQHHPNNWLTSSNARGVTRRLETLADLIITGHEHESDDASVTRASGASVSYIEGFALQSESGGATESAFKVIVIDTEAGGQVTYDLLLKDTGLYAPDHDAPPAQPLRRNPRRLERGFIWTEAGENFATDLGLPVQHDKRDRVALEDLFVYPNVRRAAAPGEGESTGRISAERVNWLGCRVLVVGADLSGKTTLAKKLFADTRNQLDLVPVYVRGIDIKRTTAGDCRRIVDRAFSSHYSTPVEKFRQLPRERKVLILDDVHRSALRGSSMARVMEWCQREFGTIIVLGDSLLLPDDASAWVSAENRAFAGYSRYEILPLGHVKQDELVNRWCSLGRDSEDRAEMRRRAAKIVQQVNLIMGRRFVPNVPFFVLGILQQLEATRDTEDFTASQGAVFEAMATLKLQIYFRDDVLTAKNYLAHFAFALFRRRQRFLTHSEFRSWHEQYCSRFKLRLDSDSMMRRLVDSQLLLITDGEVGFRHRFGYYLFVADYLSRHMEDEATRDEVAQMFRSLFHEESANILIFLCFKAVGHTEFVVRTMLQTAADVYSGQRPAVFAEDTRSFEALIASTTSPTLKLLSADDRRSTMLEAADDSEDGDVYGSVRDDDLCRDDETEQGYPGEIKEAYSAVRTIQIMGQILRNFSGILEGHQKTEIASATYDLGMRLTAWYFGFATQHREEMAREIADVLLREHPSWSSESERLTSKVRSVMAGFAELIAFGMIRRVSDATAMRALEPVHAEVLRGPGGEPTSPAYQLIDLALALSLAPRTPVDEIRAAARRLQTNGFASRVLQYLCFEHLHINYVDASTAQQVCAATGIKQTPQLFDTEIKRLPGSGGQGGSQSS